MTTRIQLKHPQGKNAVSMDRVKYDSLKKALLHHLMKEGDSSQGEICQTVTKDFKKNKTKFEGSIPWHLEWVKLDLEAKGSIARVPKTSPQKYALTK